MLSNSNMSQQPNTTCSETGAKPRCLRALLEDSGAGSSRKEKELNSTEWQSRLCMMRRKRTNLGLSMILSYPSKKSLSWLKKWTNKLSTWDSSATASIRVSRRRGPSTAQASRSPTWTPATQKFLRRASMKKPSPIGCYLLRKKSTAQHPGIMMWSWHLEKLSAEIRNFSSKRRR